jgi:hypothetical protein
MACWYMWTARDMRNIKLKQKALEKNVWEFMTKEMFRLSYGTEKRKREVHLSSLVHVVLSHNCIYNFGKIYAISLAKTAVCEL